MFENSTLPLFYSQEKRRAGSIGVDYRLGGKDRLENLEVIDLAVYLELCGQLRNKTKTLNEGQVIRDIRIS